MSGEDSQRNGPEETAFLQRPIAPGSRLRGSHWHRGTCRDGILCAVRGQPWGWWQFPEPLAMAWKPPSLGRADRNCIYLFILYSVPERIEKGLEIALYQKLLVILGLPLRQVQWLLPHQCPAEAEPGPDPSCYVDNKKPGSL